MLRPLEWLPQLDPVAFRVHDPGEGAVVLILAFGIDLHALFFQRRQQSVEIVNPVVDHETGLVRLKYFAGAATLPHRAARALAPGASRTTRTTFPDLPP